VVNREKSVRVIRIVIRGGHCDAYRQVRLQPNQTIPLLDERFWHEVVTSDGSVVLEEVRIGSAQHASMWWIERPQLVLSTIPGAVPFTLDTRAHYQ